MSKDRDRRPQRTTKCFGRAPSELLRHFLGYKMCKSYCFIYNLSTQFRPTQTRNTGVLPFSAPRADGTRAGASEQISPPPITHHTEYKTTRNLRRNHVRQWEPHSCRVGPLSRLVGRPPFEPSLSKSALPLMTAANRPNGAISLTQTYSRILFYVCNGRRFGVQNAKTGIGEQSCLLEP